MRLLDTGRLHVRRGAVELAGRHAHSAPDWEFHYFIQGQGVFRRDDVDMPVSVGSCFLSAPGEVHDILPAPRGRLVFYWMRFAAEPDDEWLLREVQQRAFGSEGAILEGSLGYLVEDVLSKFHSGEPSLARAANHLLHAFVETLSAPANRGDSRTPSPIQQAMRLMEAGLGDGFDLDRFARAAGWERSYFSRRFKRATGSTPLAHFQRLKMARASFLLRATNMSVDEIAEVLGFSDRFRFSKVFRQYLAVPPVAHRKTHGRKSPKVS